MRVEKGVVMAELRGYALMAVMIRLLFSFFMLALMGCAVREAPPSPSPIPPSPIRGYGGSSPLSSPAPPPVEDKVEVQFDRFNNRTIVRFPSLQQLATRVNTQLTPAWLATFDGQTPSTMPSTVLL